MALLAGGAAVVVATHSDPGVPPAAGPPPCDATARACVDLHRNAAWLMLDGHVEYGPVPITAGVPEFPTPPGTWHVLSTERMHYSAEFADAPMPNSVFFFPGIAFHEGSLRVPSHGCVHLSGAASRRFFDELLVGDVVQVR